jgi:hypothetical protein
MIQALLQLDVATISFRHESFISFHRESLATHQRLTGALLLLTSIPSATAADLKSTFVIK